MVHMKTNYYESQFLSGLLEGLYSELKIGNKIQCSHLIVVSELSLTEAKSFLMRASYFMKTIPNIELSDIISTIVHDYFF